MKMKLNAIFFAAVVLIVADVLGVPVSREQANYAAQRWVTSGAVLGNRLGANVQSSRTLSTETGETLHAVVFENGVAFVSSDTELEPIVAYTSNTEFEANADSPLWKLLARDTIVRHNVMKNERATMAAIAKANAAGVPTRTAKRNPEIESAKARWAALLEGSEVVGSVDPKVALVTVPNKLDVITDVRVPMLCQTQWSQASAKGQPCYNRFTPNNAPSGCTATAMSQIMKYHAYPTGSVKSRSYTCAVDGVSKVLPMHGGTYDWQKMTLKPQEASYNQAGWDAIGYLLSDTGISIMSSYTSGETGSLVTRVSKALKDAFGWKNGRAYWDWSLAEEARRGNGYVYSTRGLHSRAIREKIIYASLDAGCPVELGIYGYGDNNVGNNDYWEGHAVVGDGYGFAEYNGEKVEYVHINLGWHGLDDAWYNIPEIHSPNSGSYVGSKAKGTAFTVMSSAAYNLFPTDEGNVLSGRTVDDKDNGIANVLVEVYESGTTQVIKSMYTSRYGVYAFILPPNKDYTIRAIYNGYVVKLENCHLKGDVEEVNDIYGVYTERDDHVGNSWGNDLRMTGPTIPDAPTVRISGTTLSWDAVDGANYYKVYRSTNPYAEPVAVSGWLTTRSYTVTKPSSEGTCYFYFVKAASQQDDATAGPFNEVRVVTGDPNYTLLQYSTSRNYVAYNDDTEFHLYGSSEFSDVPYVNSLIQFENRPVKFTKSSGSGLVAMVNSTNIADGPTFTSSSGGVAAFMRWTMAIAATANTSTTPRSYSFYSDALEPPTWSSTAAGTWPQHRVNWITRPHYIYQSGVDSFSIGSTSQTTDKKGGLYSVAISATPTTTKWSASTSADWIALYRTSSTGSGVLGYIVSENTTGRQRTGTITLTGAGATKTLTVTQSGTTVSLSSISISGSDTLTSGADTTYTCTATMSDGTIKTVSPAWSLSSGSNYASITSSGKLMANTVTSSQSVTVMAIYTEGGVTKTATKSVSILAQVPDAPTGVTASAGKYYDKVCVEWTAASGATSYNLYRSTTSTRPTTALKTNVTSPYSDTTAIPGTTYYYWVSAVNSAGSSYSSYNTGYRAVTASLDSATASFGATGGKGTTTVTANTDWVATANVSWITLTNSSGTGGESVAYTVAANTLTESRTGTITIVVGEGTSHPLTKTLTISQTGAPALIDIWTALDNTTLSFSTGGASSWFGQTTTTHDGTDAMQSGALANKQSSWMQTTVSGPGTISFWWYVSSEENYDFLEFLIDEKVTASISGQNNSWTQKTYSIPSGSHTLQWRYSKDVSAYAGLDAGFVDQVVWTPASPGGYTISFNANGGTGSMASQAMTHDVSKNLTANAFTRKGYKFVGWATSANGAVVYADNALVKNLTTETGATVTLYAVWNYLPLVDPVISPADGATFVEKCSVTITCESVDAVIYYSIDGRTPSLTETCRYTGSFVVDDTVTITAVAVRGEEKSTYVKAVISKLAETQTTETPVPFAWLHEKYPMLNDAVSLEAKANETAANGVNKVWECYVSGLDPTDPTSLFQSRISFVDGKVVIEWTPYLNEGSTSRIYTVYGRKDLKAGDWEMPIKPSHKFFKVKVALPTGSEGEASDIPGVGFVPMGTEYESVQLWENGPYWSTTNIGAEQPEDPGYYFWWGDTVGYTHSGGTLDASNYYYSDVTWVSSKGERMSSSPFSSSAVPTYNKTADQLKSLGYVDTSGNLTTEHDAATQHWGSGWRMPTDAELAALVSNCDTQWTMRNGVPGRVLKGRGAFANNSIFIPAAGYGSRTYLNLLGSIGGCWSSAMDSDDSHIAWSLSLYSGDVSCDIDSRYYGLPVRPVRDAAK